MTVKQKKVYFYLYTALLTLVAFILQYNGVFSLKIGTASPMLMLSLCICYSMFGGELFSVIFALCLGFLTDGAASGTKGFFNTIVFIVLSLAVSMIVLYLFNNNFRSGLVLGILGSAVYYILRFIFCVPRSSLQNSVSYLLGTLMPSVIYTATITLALYFLVKQIFKRYYVR